MEKISEYLIQSTVTQEGEVRAWEEKVMLPTFLEKRVYQGSSGVIYPYPVVVVNDHYHSVFPPDVHAVFDHGKRDVSTFPIATGVYYKQDYSAGVDISRYKNIPVPTSYMAVQSKYDFVGGYEENVRASLLHVADHHVSPGKKQWTWGRSDFGQANAAGLFYMRRGQFVKAEPYFRKAITTLTERNPNPYDGEPYYNLGWCLTMQNRKDRQNWSSALEKAERSLIRNWHNHKARQLKASALRKMGRKDEALKWIEDSLQIDKFNMGCRFFIKATRGSTEPVQAFSYNDAQPDKIFYQGLAWRALGDEEKAHQFFNNLVIHGEKHLNEHCRIDYFAVSLSLPDLAIWDDDLNCRNQIHCNNVMGLRYLGFGDTKKAKEHFGKVAEMDVNYQNFYLFSNF